QDMQIFYNDYVTAINEEGFALSEALYESAGFLSTLRVLSEFWKSVFPTLANYVYYFDAPVDAAIGALSSLLELTFDSTEGEFNLVENGFLYTIYERAEMAVSIVLDLETKIVDEVLPRLESLEEVLGDLDEETIASLQYIMDHAGEIEDL
ncbi:unnamed protein product, partial [marine sediment metagenome]